MRTSSHSSEAKPNEKETTITKNKMITKKNEMKISQMNRVRAPGTRVSASRADATSELSPSPRMLTIGVTEAQQVALRSLGLLEKSSHLTAVRSTFRDKA